MRKFCPVIGVLGGVMGCIRDEFPVGNPVTPQLVCDDSSRFIAACSQQALEEVLCCLSVPTALYKHVHHFAVLVNCPPKIVLLPLNLDEDFVDKESITVALVPAPKSLRILWAKFDTPQPD
jgi:hypothetical protein